MTTEEKAKAYDEALKWMRELYPGLHGATKEDAEHYFPDLRESEDERIRKKCIEHFNDIINYDDARPEEYPESEEVKREKDFCKRAIAWLEKQKEHKWSPSEGEMGVLYKLCYISNQITDEDDTELTRLYQDLKREYFNGHSFENMFPSEKQKEQKPALEQTLDAYKISDERATAKMEGRIEGRQDVINNPEEYGLQKPAEWSEEDELMRTAVIQTLKMFGGRGTTEMQIDWLKSLRPQSNWKPSEEQMKQLHYALTPGSAFDCDILNELYIQLKKLK